MQQGQLNPEAVGEYLRAGNATVTLVSRKTGARFTYKVQAKTVDGGAKTLHFVKVLTGPDNESSYTFLGTIFENGNYHHGRKSPIGAGAPSAIAFSYLWGAVQSTGKAPAGVEVYHTGRCGRCGRTLTVPESVTSGYGPECIGLVSAARAPQAAVRGADWPKSVSTSQGDPATTLQADDRAMKAQFAEEERRQEEAGFLSDPDFQEHQARTAQDGKPGCVQCGQPLGWMGVRLQNGDGYCRVHNIERLQASLLAVEVS